jgi:hypothetical protein
MMAMTCERPLYARVEYAQAFSGRVLNVPEWGTAVLLRPIPGTELEDALGCYPLTVFEQGADLTGGLERLRDSGLVSVALVPDPLTRLDPLALSRVFTVCRRFKVHYLVDHSLGSPAISPTHRRWMRKASRACELAAVSLRDALGSWIRLYDATIERHAISGLQKFSTSYFGALAEMPEVEALAARVEGETVAMALWVRSPGVVYYHLGASNRLGYKTHAMYGIFALALERFAGAPILHLGGSAGIAPDQNDGLAQFKRGFANRAVEAWFCGACLDPERYAALSKGREHTQFFPAYRNP